MEEGKYQIWVDYPLYQEGYIPIITSTEVETNAFILCILLKYRTAKTVSVSLSKAHRKTLLGSNLLVISFKYFSASVIRT
jgi:hypothetical protein